VHCLCRIPLSSILSRHQALAGKFKAKLLKMTYHQVSLAKLSSCGFLNIV